MGDATASEALPPEGDQKAAVFLSVEDFAVIQKLRKDFPDWQKTVVPHAACKAAVDELGSSDRKCGATKGYRIQKLVSEAPEALPVTSSVDQKVEVLPELLPKDAPSGTLPPAELPAEDLDDDAGRPERAWPILLIAASAFVAIWSGWVGLGEMTGFGLIKPFPGISEWELNTAIALPIGVEAYAAYALRAWLTGRGSLKTRLFARNSAFGTLILGGFGQVAYHLLAAAGVQKAPWWVTTIVACIPVLCVGTGAALNHMISSDRKAYVRRQKVSQKGQNA